MRNHLFDELAVGSDEAAERHVTVPDADLTAFPEQTLDELDQRTLAQVVGPGLEAQAEHTDFPLSGVQHVLYSSFNMVIVARQNGFDYRETQIQLPGALRYRAQVLGQTGSSESEAWIEVRASSIHPLIPF